MSDSDIVSAHPNLKPLEQILNGRTVEESQKCIQADRRKINEKLQTIPSRIDEQQRNITAISSLINGDEQQRLDELLKEKSQLETQINTAGTDERISQAKAKVAEIKLEIMNAKAEYLSRTSIETDTKALDSLRKSKLSAENDLFRLLQEKDIYNIRLENIAKQGMKYNEDFKKISAEQYSGSNVCPCCGQLLPEDKIQSAITEFNLQKSAKLEEIKAACQKLKAERAELKKKLEAVISNTGLIQEKIKELTDSIERTENSVSSVIPFEKTEEYERLSMKLLDAEEEIEVAEVQTDFTEIKSQIADMEKEIARLRGVIASQSSISMYEQRIEDLKQQEKEYGLMMAKSENDLMLIEEFIKTKCAEVERMINSHFKTVKWKLFDLQVNGGINDCCEATVDGVDYSTNLNSAAKINAGLDIINAVSGIMDVSVPIWIDNAESVVNFIPTNSQTIRLIVSEEHKKLFIKEI